LNTDLFQKKKQIRKRAQPIQAATGEEAIVKLLQEKKISNKINYDVLNDLKVKNTKPNKPAISILKTEPSIALGLNRYDVYHIEAYPLVLVIMYSHTFKITETSRKNSVGFGSDCVIGQP